MFCGMPLYNHRWHKDREYSLWIPINQKPQIPSAYPNLTLQDSEELEDVTQRRFNFSLIGPDHMTIFVNVKNNAKLLGWSFNETLIRDNKPPPYFVYFSYGLDNSALEFSIDVEVRVLWNILVHIYVFILMDNVNFRRQHHPLTHPHWKLALVAIGRIRIIRDRRV